MRHPAADRDDLARRPRHALQRPVLGLRQHADARHRARHRRPRLPLHGRAGARRRRHQRGPPARARDGHRPARRASPTAACPIDLFGMDAARSAAHRRPAAGPPARRDGPAPRLPAPDPLDVARALAASRRCTSGCRSSRSPRPRPPRRCRPAAGVVSTRVDGWRGARARFLADPDAARERGPRPRRPRSSASGSSASSPTGTTCSGGGAMRIAMVSEHASPLAVLGGVDAGGQNVHVAALAAALARRGRRGRRPHPPRRPDAAASASQLAPRRRPSTTSTPGRRAPCPRTSCCQHMGAFADELADAWRADPPDVVHAHFWMSGLAALLAAREASASRSSNLPRARRGQAPLPGRRGHQPAERFELERDIVRRADRIVATCTDEVFELLRLGADRATAHRRAVRRRPRALRARRRRREPRRAGRQRLRRASGGWSSARASAT